MPRFAAGLVVGVLLATLVLSGPAGAQGALQADAGKVVYEQNCAGCHSFDLKGGSHGPPLAGPQFAKAWGPRSAADLLGFVRTMPPGRGFSLLDQDYRAAAAYILRSNGRAPEAAQVAEAAAKPAQAKSPDMDPLTAARASVPGFLNQVAPPLTPVTEAMLSHPPAQDWLSWRRTRDAQAFSPLNQINAGNVKGLQLAWAIALQDGGNETTPLVHDGVLFIQHPTGLLQAIKADTGDVIWDYRYAAPSGVKSPGGPMRNIAIYGDKLFVATFDAALVAVDARTGKQVWRTERADFTKGYTHTSGPIIANGVVVSGMAGCERYKAVSCFIGGYDPETGKELWRTYTIAQPGDPNDNTWAGLPVAMRAGADTWIPGSYDPGLDTFYIGVAQAKPWMAVSRRMTTSDAALYTNSTLALDPRTGRMKWYFQHVPGETLDMDMVFERVLVDVDGRKLLFTEGKDGVLWKLDRKTGAYVDLAGTVPQDIYKSVDRGTGKLTYRDDIVNAKVGDIIRHCPGNMGGHDWQAMAYSLDQGALIIPLLQMCGGIKGQAVDLVDGGGGLAGGDFPDRRGLMPDKGGQAGKLAAYDVRTLKPLWEVTQRAAFTTGAIATAGGLTFVGDANRHFKAFDSRTGEVLWQTRLGAAAQGFPVTFAVGAKQYVAVPAGPPYAFAMVVGVEREVYQTTTGNALYVFALP